MLLLTINIVEPLFCVLKLDQYYPFNGIRVDPCYTTNWGLPGAIKTHGWGITVPI